MLNQITNINIIQLTHIKQCKVDFTLIKEANTVGIARSLDASGRSIVLFNMSLAQAHLRFQNRKAVEDQRGTFTPFVISVDGLLHRESEPFVNCVASCIAAY